MRIQKLISHCPQCGRQTHGFQLPDGRFICPYCERPELVAYWERKWEPFQEELNRSAETAKELAEIAKSDAEKQRTQLLQEASEFEKKFANRKDSDEVGCMVVAYLLGTLFAYIAITESRQFIYGVFGGGFLLYGICKSYECWQYSVGASAVERAPCKHGTLGARKDPNKCSQCAFERQAIERENERKLVEDRKRAEADAQRQKEEMVRRAKEANELHARAKWKEYHECKPFDSLSQMSGIQFEEFVALLFSKMGYTDIVLTPINDDGGDVICTHVNGTRVAVQGKRWKGNVGNSAVQEVYAAMAKYRCVSGMVVTNSRFTAAAKDLANKIGKIDLCDGIWLDEKMKRFIPEKVPEFNWEEFNRSVRDYNPKRPIADIPSPIFKLGKKRSKFRR